MFEVEEGEGEGEGNAPELNVVVERAARQANDMAYEGDGGRRQRRLTGVVAKHVASKEVSYRTGDGEDEQRASIANGG